MKISIITVCYNAEKTLEKTIRSIAEQTYPQIEYIVVDGKSSDNTLDIIADYRKHISIVISEKDKGIYDAMNKGITAASGDILLFLNADDYLISETIIKNVCDILSDDPQTDILYGNVVVYDRHTGNGGLWKPQKMSNTLLCRSTIPHPATFFKRRVFNTTGLYNTDYKIASDYDLIVKAYRMGCRFRYEDILVSVFNNGGISTTETNASIVKAERMDILENHFSLKERTYLKFRVRVKKIFNI